ncbi:hypothetical protein KBX49_01770 [Liquorilactobacillus satsumensis]|uniref:helix-turn-helix transcriptional regulator n=1 Tax=Liquorilactobacillus satsumensis TaxID=259059 RepID=UPI0021C28DF2|nr:helix-turn-helix transcriptional regulator [Liquorilactobacillus satsumensis]MCP9356708.1 hypothetical protein [Liquorilactobacillus satsumensis]MCP9370648.1 hypothetical protein [Liquorilactobacillus satsumensis]
MENKLYFNDYVSESVRYYEKKKGLTHEQLASYLGISENFIKQVNSKQSSKHYNIYHLWQLSQFLETPIDKFLPPINDYEAFKQIMPMSTEKNYKNFIQQFKSKEECE